MGAAFILILGLSLAGGATCLLVFVTAALVRKKLRSSWLYYLWLIVLLCFIVPVPLNLPFASGGFRDASAALSSVMKVQAQPPVSLPADDPATPITPDEMSAPEYNAGLSDTAPADGTMMTAADNTDIKALTAVLRFLPHIWFAGTSTILLWTLTAYVLMLRRLRRDRTLLTPGNVPVYESNNITTPLLAGILRPAVYLPAGFSASALAVRHEFCHLRRGDIWLKWLMQLTVCVHWFNPLVWLMRRELNRFCELACDTSAVRRLGDTDRRAYGSMLLDTAGAAAERGFMPVASLGRDKQILQERLREIMNSKKTSRKAAAAMTALAAVILTAAVIFGALFSGCANQPAATAQTTPKVSGSGTDTAAGDPSPDASPEQSAAIDIYASSDTAAASPSASIIITTGVYSPLSFDNEPALTGTWQLVDTVDSIDAFDPGAQPHRIGNDSNIHLYIGEYGAFSMMVNATSFAGDESAGDIQTRISTILQSTDSYEIKEINGVKYMFVEVNSGGDQTEYEVFRKTSDTIPQAFTNPDPVPDRPPWIAAATPSP
jgi:beta-lactamase regulating signal transducer with metallopeptidase domain